MMEKEGVYVIFARRGEDGMTGTSFHIDKISSFDYNCYTDVWHFSC